MAMGTQLASLSSLSSSMQRLSLASGSRASTSNEVTRRAVVLPVIECSKHPQKKATAHHNKSRPKKHQPSDKNRRGPTYYPPLGKPPPIWGYDLSDEDVNAPDASVEAVVVA